MTTNKERAGEIIFALRSADDAEYTAQTLNDAGLLMPDLPEPNEEIMWYSPSDDHNKPFEVWVSHHGTVEVSGLSSPQITLPLDRARRLAFSIIAALNHEEMEE